jgi:hypothetical protein
MHNRILAARGRSPKDRLLTCAAPQIQCVAEPRPSGSDFRHGLLDHRATRHKNTRGSALLEFTLVGIMMMFVWISIEEMARGMWNYHTLQYAVKTATSYASVHGATCSMSPNSCPVNVSDVVGVFRKAAIGVPMDQVTLTLTTASGAATTCNPVSTCSSNSAWSTMWPPSSSSDNAVGKDIYMRADYTFHTALGLYVPGAGSVSFGSNLGSGVFDFPGYSHQSIVF